MQDAVRKSSPFRQGLWSVGFVLTLFAASVLAIYGFRSARRADAERAYADHTGRVLQATQHLETLATRLEANQRGFLINGDAGLERARDADYRQAVSAIAGLRAMITSDPIQIRRLNEAAEALQQRYARMVKTSKIEHEHGLPAARDAFASHSTAAFDIVQRRLSALRNEEAQRLVEHSIAAAQNARRFNEALTLGAVILFLLLADGGATLWLQRRRSEALRDALARSDALQRAVLESAGSMVIATDTQGVITLFNFAASQALGYAAEEVIGQQKLTLFHHPEEVHAHAVELSQTLRATIDPGFETLVARARQGATDVRRWTYVRRDGATLRVQLSVAAVRAPTGTLLGFVGVAQDVTEQEQAHERVRQGELHLRTIIDTASDAFIAIDANGLIEDWNTQAERVMGWTRDEALGQPLAELIIPLQYRDAHNRGLMRYLKDGYGPVLNRRIEISALDRSGHEFPIELTVWPMRSESRISFNAFIHDITERRAAQDRIRTLNAELTQQTEQLTQTNRELESFSYSVSHDLRAPLRHMSGYAQMLRDEGGEGLSASMQRYIEEITDGAKRMGSLIDDLLAFSRLSRQALTMLPIDMNAVVADAMCDAGLARNPQATIDVEHLPAVQGDPVLLKQVWVNLISNAIKYSAPRGADALIQIRGENGDGRVRYRIRDNGVGFDPRYADKLFGVFQRLHSNEEFEGTGVGLAIVQRIVARHRGQIAANSELGHGAEFTIDLPLHKPLEVAA